MELQRLSGIKQMKRHSGAVSIYMNADDIHHMFHRAAGLWADRVMTIMLAVI